MTIEVEQCTVCFGPIMADQQGTRIGDSDQYAHKRCLDDQDGLIIPSMIISEYIELQAAEGAIEWAGRIIAGRQITKETPLNELYTCALYLLGRYGKSYTLAPIKLMCSGEAHSNLLIDHCGVCSPWWEEYPVCPGCKTKLSKHGSKGGLICNHCQVIFLKPQGQ